jgi:hypothetical protein
LFKDHPHPEECPICALPLPLDPDQKVLKSCCGKIICKGCIYEMGLRDGRWNQPSPMRQPREVKKDDYALCPFCRTPLSKSNDEYIKRLNKLVENGNAFAHTSLGEHYDRGSCGFLQDKENAVKLYLKAGELGCSDGYNNLAISYKTGDGVAMNMKKAKHFYELSALNGNVAARHNLGCLEGNNGNTFRAIKHFIIAARAGHNISLDEVKVDFMRGFVSKDVYEDTLRAYQKRMDEMKSDMREKAVTDLS